VKLRNPYLIKMAGWLGAGALRAWSSTLRCLTDAQGQQTDPWDPALQERYWEQIPVTLVDGKQHDFWRVDETRLRRALGG